MKHIYILILLVFSSLLTQAQYYTWGNDKGNTKWKQINTENFQVIYPEGYDSVANLFAQKLLIVYGTVSKSLDHQPKKISVILHNQSTISNAFVSWAPSRMEVFDVPSQGDFAQDWLDLLAIHEYRHVVQTDKMNQGLTNIFYFLLGEQGIGLVLGAYVPIWFMEGDAVCAETAFSNSGRGRQATFSMGLRAQFHEKGIFSYDKAYYGSYKDFVPDHYKLGYFYVGGVRSMYDPSVWNSTLNRVAQKPLSITPFNKGLKLATGMGKVDLYNAIFEKQNTYWELDYSREGQSPFDTLTIKNADNYTNYKYPRRLQDSSILAEKRSMNNIPLLVKIKNGKETKITNLASKNSDEPFSNNQEYIVWAEENPNIRWELKSSNDIYYYHFESKKLNHITTKKRIFSPAISPASTMVVCVEIGKNNKYALTFYNLLTQEVSESVPIPDNNFPQNPAWNPIGNKVVFTSVSKQGKRILEYDLNSKEFTEILPYTYEDIATPIYYSNYILYSSSYSGVDNIYAIDRFTKNIFRLTSSSFGAKFPSVWNKKLMFSDYSSDGFVIGEKAIFEPSWYSIDVIKPGKYRIAETLKYQENNILEFPENIDTTFESKPYRKPLHLFNIHSWFPTYISYNSGFESGFGAEILSQNKLSTMISRMGYRSELKGNKYAFFGEFSYTGWFPVIDFSIEKGYTQAEHIYNTDTARANFGTQNTYTTITLPLNFSSRAYNRFVSLQASVGYNSIDKISEQSSTNNVYVNEAHQTYGSYQFLLSNTRKQAYRELQPKWGIRVEGGQFFSSISSLTSDFHSYFGISDVYLPGIIANQGLHVNVGYQWNSVSRDILSEDYVSLPRGIEQDAELPLKDITSGKVSYVLPISYPDVNLGPIFYLKRLRAMLFADYTYINETSNISNEMYSFGFELTFDMHIFRLLPQFSLGYQQAYVNSEYISYGITFNYSL